MFIVGFDLGKRKSQMCVQDASGKVLAEVRTDTTAEALATVFAKYPKARVLIEASTSSEWVARTLEKLGLDVVVADPRFSPMYAQSNKKVKNDRRDARALADALRLTAFRRVHRKSDQARNLHNQLLVRQRLVMCRTQLINLARALCEREGVIVPACDGNHFVDVMREEVDAGQELLEAIAPLVTQIEALTVQLDLCGKALAAMAKASPVARNLQTVRGVGPLTALAFMAVIDDPARFESARQVSAYLGLVPGEHNTGESKRAPHAITKTGDPMLRQYLVEAAFVLTNKLAPDSALKRWHAERLPKTKKKTASKKKAAVAVARRLSRILWAMWRDNAPFDDSLTAPRDHQLPAATAEAA